MDIANEVDRIMRDCLNGTADGAVIVDGIVRKFGLNPEKISSHNEEIRALLNEMPDTFHKDTGGGWSFLNLCVDKSGAQWGEHSNMEALLVLGIAAGMAEIMIPRDMWAIFPGGMPYVVFDTKAPLAKIDAKTGDGV